MADRFRGRRRWHGRDLPMHLGSRFGPFLLFICPQPLVCCLVGVQYLRAKITDEQRQEFATLVEDTVRRIESGLLLSRGGIRFPQNPCTTCPFLGLCLDKRDLVEAARGRVNTK